MENLFETKNRDEENKVRMLKGKLEKIYAKSEIEKLEEIQDKIIKLVNRLKKRYPDYGQYLLYHVLTGSTPFERCSKFDFPDNDSVEKLIDSL